MSKSRDNSSGFSLTTFPWLAATELRYTQVTVSNGALLPAAPVTTPVTVCVLRLWVWDCVAVMSARRSAVLLTHLPAVSGWRLVDESETKMAHAFGGISTLGQAATTGS